MKATKSIPKEDHGQRQAVAQLESIREMVKALKDSEHSSRHDLSDQAVQAIQEDPLSVLVRSGWNGVGELNMPPEEFEILLCTGGPACRIIGTLDQYNQPETARIEYQDWGTPWTEYRLDAEEEADVLTYSRQFYFGE